MHTSTQQNPTYFDEMATNFGRSVCSDETPSLYYNTNFSTFPNPRRHSIASSSMYSSSANWNANKGDGYLVPIETKGTFVRRGNMFSDKPLTTYESSEANIHSVDNGAPSSDLGDFGLMRNSFQSHSSGRDLQHQSSNDSTSTLIASGSTASQENPNQNKRLPSSRRILSSGSECELLPYCSLCAPSVKTPKTPFSSSSRKSTMEVAFVSCHECFFSQRAEGQLKGLFLKNESAKGHHKLELRLQSYDLKEMDKHDVAAEVHRSKVQIVIISNHFLDRLRHEASLRKKISPLNRILRPNRVIAVLVSLSSKDIIEGYQNVLSRFREWHSVELRATSKLDAEFCKAFTDQITRIYNAEISNLSHFSVFPKKVTKEQPKVMVMFKKPIESTDLLRVELTRGKETEHINEIMSTNPYTAIIKIPDALCAERTALIEITLFINDKKLGTKLIKCEYQGKQMEEDVIERMVHALPGFRKMLDEHISQVLSSDLRSNNDCSLNPAVELMNDSLICKGDEFPTMLHFAAYYGLEQTVLTLLEVGDGLEQCSVLNDRGDSPLTIANARGFKTSIAQMIKDYQEVSVSYRAFQFVKDLYERHSDEAGANLNEVSVSNDSQVLAEDKVVYSNVEVNSNDDNNSSETNTTAGNSNVSSLNYNDSELKNVVSDVSESNAPAAECQDSSKSSVVPMVTIERESLQTVDIQSYDIPPTPVFLFEANTIVQTEMAYYDTPRPLGADYCIPPTDPKPVLPEKRIGKGPVLTKKTGSTISSDQDGYILVDPSRNERISISEPDVSILEEPVVNSGFQRISVPDISEQLPDKPVPASPPVGNSKQVILDPTEEELVELMNGFRNNVYSMRELELLFENWKTRTDVQRDFMDRQKELNDTREHYKKIQERMRRNNKNFSPLDRFLKFIPGSRKKHSTTDSPVLTTVILQDEGSNEKGASVQSVCSSPDIVPSDNDCEKAKGQAATFWRNPLDSRFVPMPYVTPNQSQAESKPEDNSSIKCMDTPPPRPLKKPSLITECPPGISPPMSPFLTKKPPLNTPISANPNPNDVSLKSRTKSKKDRDEQPPAPQPPPRSTKHQPPPYNFVSYKPKVNGVG